MKLSEMKQILARGDIVLTKSLGQNFLHDGNQLGRIVTLAELQLQDKVLEIGPGLGPLTERLIAEAGEVLAIEKDARLVKVLQARLADSPFAPKLRLVTDDALEFLRRDSTNWAGWKLVANLPYSVASPILVELALANHAPDRMVATLQLEVARRLAAQCGGSDYGVLTLLVQLGYEVSDWFRIPAGCFYPEPNVDSACVCLIKRHPVLLGSTERHTFARLVKRGFSQRRKMMLKLLRDEWPGADFEGLFDRVGISARARAESVTLEQFVALAQSLTPERVS